MIKRTGQKFFKKVLLWKIHKVKRKLINRDFSLICNNCISGIIYNDLGLQFKTPTINLYFYAPDYIDFLENFELNMAAKLKFVKKSRYYENLTYPVGVLNGAEIHFLHYVSESEAEICWEKRKQRIDFNNLFIIGSDRDSFNDDLLLRFHNLRFTNKLFFVAKQTLYPECIWFRNYQFKEQVGDLINDGKAWYFMFDVAHWFNTGKVRKYFLWRWFYFICYKMDLISENER